MIIQKLSWAGVSIQSEKTVILIDPLSRKPEGQDRAFAARVGEPLEPLIPFANLPKPEAILITHLHADHFDPVGIQSAFGAGVPVVVPDENVELAEKTGLQNVLGAAVGFTHHFGCLTVKASYSADGYGTPQISWVVEGVDGRIIHFGDTLWHGNWWKLAREHGPFDIACLPVNGPVLEVKGLPVQSRLPACLTPEEAVEAAKILAARLLPIHFGTFHNPPFYTETPNLMERLFRCAAESNVQVDLLQPGEAIRVRPFLENITNLNAY